MVAPHTALAPIPALALGTLGVVVATVALIPFGEGLPRTVPALLLIVPVVVAGVLGGRLVATVIAFEAAFALAAAFLPPIGSPTVELGHDAVALGFFIVVAGGAGVATATVITRERERSVAERARRQALEWLDQQRSALLRSVSHDLRTPLATIRAVATDLQAGAPYDEATRAELIDLVIVEAERLDRLVANVLSMGRIEAGALRPARDDVDVAELVAATSGRLGRLLQPFEVVVDVDADLPTLQADRNQLDQVLSNLLENAARHSPPGGRITIAAVADGPDVTVTVSDAGPGVPEAVRDEVLEPFATAGGSSSTGIGLAICRSVVEAHGGSISIDDALDGGARFSIVLPVEPPVDPGRG